MITRTFGTVTVEIDDPADAGTYAEVYGTDDHTEADWFDAAAFLAEVRGNRSIKASGWNSNRHWELWHNYGR